MLEKKQQSLGRTPLQFARFPFKFIEMSSGTRHAVHWAGMFVEIAGFKLFGVGNRVEDKVGGAWTWRELKQAMTGR